MERLVKFEVLGQEYPLYTDAPVEDVKEILQLVKTQLESLSKSSSQLPANKLAILTSLNMAGKYVKLKNDFEQYRQLVTGAVQNMTLQIENTLQTGDSINREI